MIAVAREAPAECRYTVDGSEALENFLGETCDRVLGGIRRNIPSERLQGLLLAGGYGRGEGGVLQTADGDRPYNDLDFYVFLAGNHLLTARAFNSRLHHLSESLSGALGIEIELKGDSLARWRRLPITMFSYDVMMGHQWVSGDDCLFAGCEHHREAERIPGSEAARLLLNRCSGLLFAAEHLQRKEFTPEAADFVARNLAKAQLGLGDAVLTMFQRYHWSCRERHGRLKDLPADLPWREELLTHHRKGVEFKLHPQRSQASRGELQRAHDQISTLARKVWLWAESRRLGRLYGSPVEYSKDGLDKCPETAAWRNCLVNLRTFGNGSWRYPRERLFRALPLLLWDRECLNESFLKQTLNACGTDFSGYVQAYRAVWQRFN